MKANLITLAVVLVALAWLVAHSWGQPWTPMRIAGAVIGLPSLVLLIVARVQLGGSFSVRPRAQALVTHGLYSRIRNPIYVFGGFDHRGNVFVPRSERKVSGCCWRSYPCRFTA